MVPSWCKNTCFHIYASSGHVKKATGPDLHVMAWHSLLAWFHAVFFHTRTHGNLWTVQRNMKNMKPIKTYSQCCMRQHKSWHDITWHASHGTPCLGKCLQPKTGLNIACTNPMQLQISKVFLFHGNSQSMKSLWCNWNICPECVPIVQVTLMPCPSTTKAGLTSPAQSRGPHPALAMGCST